MKGLIALYIGFVLAGWALLWWMGGVPPVYAASGAALSLVAFFTLAPLEDKLMRRLLRRGR